ncbi:alpha/beta hydrolase-fold protein [Salmonirosea aquatica]|uniref:Peptidase n=1 Tax=Salmonirosea aquatica TaxID=2654236 RepID=A0A7C9FRE8_9BACT|nr:peptidase [Cytophagaceae bacterium SJW1-29]
MNKDSYVFANFFLGLSVACGVLQSIVHFLIGAHIYTQSSSSSWYLVTNLVSLIGFLFYLQYFHHKQYQLAFSTGLLAILANIILASIVYAIMLLFKGLERYHPIVAMAALGTSLVHSLALIFSKAGQRFWLKIAGIGGAILALTLLIIFLLAQSSPEVWPKQALDKVSQWASLAGLLLPVLYILNFRDEIKKLPSTEKTNAANQFSESFMGLLGVLALGATLFFGFRIALQGYEATHVSASVRILANQFEARTYVNRRGEKLSYRLIRPLSYDSTQRYPLVVCLHGGAGYGTDNMRQIEGIDRMLASDSIRKKYPAFLFVPQIQLGTSWGGVPGLIAKDSLVFETMAALEKEFSIDPTRRYVLGHSLGGFGTWYFIGTQPDLFAAAMPFAGQGDPALARNMTGVAVWAFHGTLDRNVPVSGSRDVIGAIKKAGVPLGTANFPTPVTASGTK